VPSDTGHLIVVERDADGALTYRDDQGEVSAEDRANLREFMIVGRGDERAGLPAERAYPRRLAGRAVEDDSHRGAPEGENAKREVAPGIYEVTPLAKAEAWAQTRDSFAERVATAKSREDAVTAKERGGAVSAGREAIKDLRGRLDRGEISPEDAIVEASGLASYAARDLELIRSNDPDRPARFVDGQHIAFIAMAGESHAVVALPSGEGKTVIDNAVPVVRAALFDEKVYLTHPGEGLADQSFAQLKKLADYFGVPVAILKSGVDPRTGARIEAENKVVTGAKHLFGFAKMDGGPEVRAGWAQPDGFVHAEVDQTRVDRAGERERLAMETGDEAPVYENEMAVQAIDKAELRPVTDESLGGDYRIVGQHTELTEAGIARLREAGMDVEADLSWRGWVESALFARDGFKIDEDFVDHLTTKDGDVDKGVYPIDLTTGEARRRHRLEGGRQEALEYVNNRKVGRPTKTVDTMTIDELVKGSWETGSSGTIDEFAEARFAELGKKVVHIAPENPRQAKDYEATFEDPQERDEFAIELIERANNPEISGDDYLKMVENPDHEPSGLGASHGVLVGAQTDAQAEAFAAKLRKLGYDVELLTAKNFWDRQRIFDRAAKRGAITVTSLRLRGQDPLIGGNAKDIVDNELMPRLLEEHPELRDDPTLREQRRAELLTQVRLDLKAEKSELNVAGGGLHTILLGSDPIARNETQGRARSGRQGEHGVTWVLRSTKDRPLEIAGEHDYVEIIAEPAETMAEPALETGVPAPLTGQDAELADLMLQASRQHSPGTEDGKDAEAGKGNEAGKDAEAGKDGKAGTRDTPGPARTKPTLTSTNPMGLDLHALAMARAGVTVPWLSAEQNKRLRTLATRSVERPSTAADGRAAARVAELIPA
jgi:preprotein translocase subunit SecA